MKRDKKIGIKEPRMRTLIRAQVRDDKVILMNPPCWVKVGDVTKETGWNYKILERRRKQGHIPYERRADGMWYDIANINPYWRQHA
jgi:hypothetical protein